MLRLKDNVNFNTTGNAATATKATQDGSGNVITTTYATKASTISSLSVDGVTVTYTKADGTTGTITTKDTTYSVATTSADGLMSSADKSKLDGIATGATNVTTTTVSGWGYTKNAGTITGIKMNGASKGTSGVVDLGTVITSHQDISKKIEASNIKAGDNITVTTSGNNVTINSTGGGTDEVVVGGAEPTDENIKLYVDVDDNDSDGIGIADSLPIGSIIPYASNTMPDNYILCDGRAISRTNYSELYALIGTTYGSGDGSTTFNVPNLKSRMLVGTNTAKTGFSSLGLTGGTENHSHKYGFQLGGYYGDAGFESSSYAGSLIYDSSGNITVSGCGSNIGTKSFTINGNNTASTRAQDMATYRMIGQSEYLSSYSPYLTTNYIIKVKNNVVVYGVQVVNGLNSTSSTDALSAAQGKVLNEKIKTLWSTSSSSTQSAFNITLNSSDYDYLIVLSYRNVGANLNQTVASQMCEKNKYGEILYNDTSGSSARSWNRKFKIVSGTSVQFETCYINGEENTGTLIPYKVIGYKY